MKEIVIQTRRLDGACERLLNYAKDRMLPARYEKLREMIAFPSPPSLDSNFLPQMKEDFARGHFDVAFWYAFFDRKIPASAAAPEPRRLTITGGPQPESITWSARPSSSGPPANQDDGYGWTTQSGPAKATYVPLNALGVQGNNTGRAGRRSQGADYVDGVVYNEYMGDDEFGRRVVVERILTP